jgi:Flp pilus assembly protein TadG
VSRADRGSAVVGFALVLVPLVVLVLATVQAIAYLRLRDLVAAAAEQGARAGAAAGASTRDGAARADAVLGRSLPSRAVIRCTATDEGAAAGTTDDGAATDDGAGPVLVAVRCGGRVPAILSVPAHLPIRVTAHAVGEGS